MPFLMDNLKVAILVVAIRKASRSQNLIPYRHAILATKTDQCKAV